VNAPRAVAIGASAGAVQALMALLPALPADFALPVFVVVHVPPGRRNALAALFAETCGLTVREAEDKDPIQPGIVYFAPPDYHLLVETPESLALSTDEAVSFSRPAVDVLFETAAAAYGTGLVAIVLTGANADGAAGLRCVVQAGGLAIVQDPAEAQADFMPRAAIAAAPAARVLGLAQIAGLLSGLPACRLAP
jgi:two-component system, chemotaxis family, protein-glutamate methylesterase/glutaminase